MLRQRTLTPLFEIAVALVPVACVAAQDCGPKWLAGTGGSGTDGDPQHAVVWDPDGDGPLSKKLVIAGWFDTAGNARAANIAMMDLETERWSGFGESAPGLAPIGGVDALLATSSGGLIIAGAFSDWEPYGPRTVARWSGSQWTPLGGRFFASGGFPRIFAMTETATGEIVVIGNFDRIDSQMVSNAARWDGASWHPMGCPLPAWESGIATLPNGDLLLANARPNCNIASSPGLVRWDHQTGAWTLVNVEFGDSDVSSLVIHPNGDIVAGGVFCPHDQVCFSGIAQWTGSAWVQVAAWRFGLVTAMDLLADGTVVAAGERTWIDEEAWSGAPIAIVNLDNGSVEPLELGVRGTENEPAVLKLLSLPNGEILALGRFSHAGRTLAHNSALWTNDRWEPIGSGPNGMIFALHTLANGEVVVGGRLDACGGQLSERIIRWDGLSWLAMAGGVRGLDVKSITETRNGYLYAGGEFVEIGTLGLSGLQRWDGEMWEAAPDIEAWDIHSLATSASGDLVAAGRFQLPQPFLSPEIARWNHEGWESLNGVGIENFKTLLALPNGDLLGGGEFCWSTGDPVNSVGRWNGYNWEWVGSNFDIDVRHLASYPSGGLIAGGDDGLWRWSGTQWSPIPMPYTGQSVDALAVYPNGEIVVASSGSLWRWRGEPWEQIGDAMAEGYDPSLGVYSLAVHPSGELLVGGNFTSVNEVASSNFARWTPNNRPWIVRQTQLTPTCEAPELGFSAWPAVGYANLHADWQIETAPGSGIFISHPAGPIVGAEPAIAEITPLDASEFPGPTTLAIERPTAAMHNRRIRCVISNACGSATSTPVLVESCPGDHNCDASVDLADLIEFLSNWQPHINTSQPAGTNGDYNGDGSVDLADLIGFNTAWQPSIGQTCP